MTLKLEVGKTYYNSFKGGVFITKMLSCGCCFLGLDGWTYYEEGTARLDEDGIAIDGFLYSEYHLVVEVPSDDS